MDRRRPQSLLTRSHIFTIAFFTLLLFLLYQAGRLLSPFSGALLWAGIIALALHPLYRRLLALVKGRQALAASIMTLITLISIIGPAIAALTVLVSQTIDLYQSAEQGVHSGAALDLLNRTTSVLSEKMRTLPLLAGIDIKTLIINGLRDFSASLALQVGTILKNTLFLLVDLFIIIFSLFFFFLNGHRYYQTVMSLIPFSEEQKQSISLKLYDTFRAVINGVFLVALGQGIMSGIGFAIFGVPFPVFWGSLAAILALLPIGGTALVWIPAAVYLMLSKATLQAALLSVWSILLVSLPDNFLKPLLIGKKSNLPTFFLFLGILGGVQVYGFLGILFGPLIVTLLTALVDIYREEFHEHENS